MNNPELYGKINQLPRRDTQEYLRKYSKIINWKECDNRSIDIGSGDGNVTSEILKSYLPENFEVLIGCDISEVMVKYANEHFGDARTKFILQDITNELSEDLRGGFDQVFSFYVFHFFKDRLRLRKAFENVYKLLADDGISLVIFLKYSPLFDIYLALAEMDRWRPFFQNLEKFIPPFQNSTDPEKELTELIEDIGFKDFQVLYEKRTFYFDSAEHLKTILSAIDPFNIPKDIYEQFFNNFMEVAIDTKALEMVPNEEGKPTSIKQNYGLMTFVGMK